MTDTAPDPTLATLLRIADALERLAPPAKRKPDLSAADAFVWHAAGHELAPVAKVKKSQIREIAETKMKDLNANDIEMAMKTIEGSARAMGLEVVEG